MKVVRYAGFDPDEDNFDGVEPAPLHPEELLPPRRQARTYINVERARELKLLGRSWAEVGWQLAKEEGRRIAYRGESVRFAVNCATPCARRAS